MNLNAMIFPVPQSDEYLIVINSGLWNSTQAVSYLISSSLEFGGLPIPTGFDENRATANLESFTKILGQLTGQSSGIKYAPMDVESYENYYWELLDGSMKDFIFGHEYAHFLHSHFDTGIDERRATVVLGNIDFNSIIGWENEYEADRTGLDLAVFMIKERYRALAEEEHSLIPILNAEGILIGVEGSLIFLHLLNEAERLNNLVYRPESSHPPTWMRITHIWSVLGQQVPDVRTLEYAKRRLSPSLNCFSFFLNQVTPYMSDQSLERIFQDRVFPLLFEHTHNTLISELRILIKALNSTTPLSIKQS